MAGKSANPAYPDANPTAPGGMSKADLRLELAEKHGISMDETRETGWPTLIDMVIEQRQLRERGVPIGGVDAIPSEGAIFPPGTECSYCETVAAYRDEEDFYCAEHVDEAPGEVTSLVEVEHEEQDEYDEDSEPEVEDMFDLLDDEPEPEGDTDETDEMLALLDEDDDDEPFIWDGKGGKRTLADHAHVHDASGRCIKKRHGQPCAEVLDDEDHPDYPEGDEPVRDDAREQALRGMDMPALKAVAKAHGMTGYSTLRRAALIEAILEFEARPAEPEEIEVEGDIIDPEMFFAEMVSERDEHEAEQPPPLFIGMPGIMDYVFDGHAGAGPSAAERWMTCTASLQASRRFLETLTPNQQIAYANNGGSAARQGTTAHAAAEVEANHVLGRVDAEEVNTTLLELMADREDDEAYDEEMGEYITEYVGLVQSLATERGAENIRIESRVNAAIPLTDLHEGEVYIVRGSADCAALPTDEHPELVVADLKYGNGLFVDVEENPQVRLYALGVLEELVDEEGMLTVDIDKITYYIAQPRLGGLRPWSESLDDLLDWRDEVLAPALTAALGGVDEGGAEFVPGDVQCQFCPARGTCPALAKARIEAAADAFDAVQEAEFENGPGSLPDPALMDNATLGAMLKQVRDLVKLHDDLKEEGQRRLHRGEQVPGFKLVNYSPPRHWAENMKHADLVRALGGEQAKTLYTTPELISPTKAEKLLGKEGYPKIESLVVKPDKRPVMGTEDDRRSEWVGRPPEQMFEDESGSGTASAEEMFGDV